MKNVLILGIIICAILAISLMNNSSANAQPMQKEDNGTYTLVVEGFDWGAAASKVILAVEKSVSEVKGSDFEVLVQRATACAELSPEEASGQLRVLYAYVSDAKANRVSKGKHITLILYAAPFESLGSPIKYFGGNPKCPGNRWMDFKLNISNTKTKESWNQETNRIIPLIDEFDLSGTFTHKGTKLTYADFEPKNASGQRPLLIWLHGGGEGGTDTSIPLLANRAANYAAPEIQAYFGGAYVLVPQAPTFWMDNGKGQHTRGEVNDRYNESLMALIKDYVDTHPNVDPDRVYVGGCSNGGYMTLKLLLLYPDYFAAGFPSALAYDGKNLTEADIQRIKDIPIWFIHSKDDPVTKAVETAVPTYEKLIKAGAKNVHFSYFDHVIDITNQFGGANYHYNGHFSWIYSHTNKCQLDYDGKPVLMDGKAVTLMGWMANQRRNAK